MGRSRGGKRESLTLKTMHWPRPGIFIPAFSYESFESEEDRIVLKILSHIYYPGMESLLILSFICIGKFNQRKIALP